MVIPRRRRTRKQERDERIETERAINEQLIRREQRPFAELEKRRQARNAHEPPPF